MRSTLGMLKLVTVVVILVFAIVSFGCAPQAAPVTETQDDTGAEPAPVQEQPEEPSEINVRIFQDLQTTDPAFITASSDYIVVNLVHNGLVKRDPASGEIVGDLATDWDISEDGLRYSFTLREGVQWHTGEELTAKDVKYTFERMMNPDLASVYYGDFANVDRIEVEGDYTVHIYLKEPFPDFMGATLAYRPGYIVKQDAIEEAGDKYVGKTIGTGPYIFESWEPGVEIVLTKNENYFGDVPAIDKVNIKIIPEDTTAEIALERGELDMAYFSGDAEVQKRLIDNPNIETQELPGPRTVFLWINWTKQPWDDVRVRRALFHATNRDEIINTLMEGMGVPAYSLLNPNVFGYLNEQRYEYDPEKARELLAEAGHPDGFDETFEFAVVDLLGFPDWATVLQQQWKEVGINIELTVMERGAYEERMRPEPDWDMLIWARARDQASQYLVPYATSDGYPQENFLNYIEAEDLIFEAVRTVDDARRAELLQEAQRQMQEDAVVLPLAHPVFQLAYQPYVEGAVVGLLLYNIEDVTLNK
jgi:peptide/nickel transport system substrate-binding protein